MAHRKPLVAYAAEVSGLALMQCREEHVSARMERLEAANAVLNEFAEIAELITRSLHEHGEVTERSFRRMRERVRDLAVIVLGRTDVPGTEAATSCVAD